MQSSIRQSNFEVLRLVLMLFILIHHGIVMALGLGGIAGEYGWVCHLQDADIPLMFFVNSFCIVAVNAFILISGYFGIKLKSHKVWSLFFAMMFYTLLFSSLPYLLQGDVKHAIISAAPFSQTQYWFVREYFFLMLFAPLLNHLFDTYSKKQVILFIAVLVLISCYIGFVWQKSVNRNGYNFVNFMLLYSIGRYLRQYNFQLRKYTNLAGYIVCSMALGGICVFFAQNGHKDLSWQMTYYNNPLIILSALFLFGFFRAIDLKSSFVNKISQSALSVYLFTSSVWISKLWYDWVLAQYSVNHRMGGGILAIILATALLQYIVAILIDQVRLFLWNKVSSKYLKNGLY